MAEPRVRNLVLLGRTGRGKSATGNTLVGRTAFQSQRGAAACTVTCEVHSKTYSDGTIVNVCDTPGLFDPGLSNQETLGELAKVLSLVPGGVIHGALIVLNGDDTRFTSEEQCALRLLHLLFGPRLFDVATFVFTRGDYFKGFSDFEAQVIAPLLLSGANVNPTTASEVAASSSSPPLEQTKSSATQIADTSLPTATANTATTAAAAAIEPPALAGGARALRNWLHACGRRVFLIDNSAVGSPSGNDQAEALLQVVDANSSRLAHLRAAPTAGGDEGSNTVNSSSHAEVGTNDINAAAAYSRVDFEEHAASLTEAQRKALAEPQSPEKQAAFALALQGEVGGLKREIGSLKSLVQQMSTEQSATLMAIVQQMRAPQQQSKPAEPSLNKS